MTDAPVIDAHIHAVNSRLPGAKADQGVLARPAEDVAARLKAEMAAAGIAQVLAMGSLAVSDDDPLGVGATLEIARLVPGLHAVGVADPAQTDADHLRRVEEALARGDVKALKGYSGYVHHGPDSPAYVPYYALAARYQIPFIFHTGDTYSTRAKLKYAHPLLLDEAAVDHPDVRFVLAHCGNPWLIDAAEIIYKNDNVWADLSGLLVGDATAFDAMARDGTLDKVACNVAAAFEYAERPDRFLYGSDWPLAPLGEYLGFAKRIIPEAHQEAVFAENARALFGLGPD